MDFNKLSQKEKKFVKKIINDFPSFLVYCFKCLGLPKPTPLQMNIAYELQQGNTRLLIMAFRGIGKTTITAIYAAWKLLRNPNEKILIVSATQGHAGNISTGIFGLLNQVPILNSLKPSAGQRKSTLSFDVNGATGSKSEPSVNCLGIGSQLQGKRATLIIADDIETSMNSATEVQREKIQNQINEFDSILKTDPNSSILSLGTPQSLNSIYNRFIDKGFLVRIWPARIPKDVNFYEGKIAPYIEDLIQNGYEVGDPTDTRFTDDDLKEREMSTGKSYFNLQMMLDTTLSDAFKFPLKQSDFIVYDISDKAPASISYGRSRHNIIKDIPNIGFTGDCFYQPSNIDENFIDFQQTFMSIDPSGSGSDELAYSIISLAHGKVFIRKVNGLQGGYEDKNLMKLALEAKEFKVQKIIVETNFGSGMFEKLLAPFIKKFNPCEIESITNTKQKELRIIDTLEPLLNQHRLVIDRQLIEDDINDALSDPDKISYSLIYQLTHLTKDRNSLKHDDRLDALSIALGYLDEYVGADSDEMLKNFKEEILDRKLAKFIDSFNNTNSNNCFNHKKH